MVPPEMDAEEELVESSTAKLVFDGLLGPLASSIRSTGNLGRIQLLRSGTWWSLGLPTDTSIYNAYLEFIREARNFIYIENQFFITTCVEDNEDGINNLIGKAIAERVWDSYSTGGNLKVYIVLPVMPAFENAQLMQPNGFVTRITLQHQFNAFMRGRGSILGFLESACGDRAKAEEIFSSHFVVCGLRQVDVWPDGTVRSEQLYVHSKAMIVDDHVAIIGSANINDRSMVGDRDSEVAICIEDPDFAQDLRKQLWHEHFGITVHHPSLTIASDSPDVRTELIAALADPTSADCFNIWVKAANDNGEVYRDVFGVVPCDRVKTRKQFDIRMEVNANRKVTLHDADATARIRTLKGRIVAFQHKFLELEDRLQDPMPASASLCPREIFS
jgi:phospholipase D1/2